MAYSVPDQNRCCVEECDAAPLAALIPVGASGPETTETVNTNQHYDFSGWSRSSTATARFPPERCRKRRFSSVRVRFSVSNRLIRSANFAWASALLATLERALSLC